MYAWIWRHLPFGRPGRIVGSVLLVAVAVAALWFGVFPRVEAYMPWESGQITTGSGDGSGGGGGAGGGGAGGPGVGPTDNVSAPPPGVIPYDTQSNNPAPPPSTPRPSRSR